MRTRAKRDLITLLGVVVIVVAILFINMYLRLDSMKEAARKMRAALEEQHRAEGVEVIDWEMLHKTKGTLHSGPQFEPAMKEKEGRAFNMVGFMAPIDEFRNVKEFMLLPFPIECYFCESPPPRDIVHVKLEDPTAEILNEPVLIGGQLELYEEEGVVFFQALDLAKFNEPVTDEDFSERVIAADHRMHLLGGFERTEDGTVKLKSEEVELFPGAAPPTPVDDDESTEYGPPMLGASEE